MTVKISRATVGKGKLTRKVGNVRGGIRIQSGIEDRVVIIQSDRTGLDLAARRSPIPDGEKPKGRTIGRCASGCRLAFSWPSSEARLCDFPCCPVCGHPMGQTTTLYSGVFYHLMDGVAKIAVHFLQRERDAGRLSAMRGLWSSER